MPPTGFTRLVDSGDPDTTLAWSQHYVASTDLQFAELNGDGRVDLFRADGSVTPDVREAWIQDPGQLLDVWVSDSRFLPPASAMLSELYTFNGSQLKSGNGVRLADADGNGTLDFIRAYGASGWQTDTGLRGHGDRLLNFDNGVGGTVALEYTSLPGQRDSTLDGLAEADLLADPGDEEGVERWAAVPVVTQEVATDVNARTFTSSFGYAHPRWSGAERVALGFRLSELVRPDASVERTYRYQKLGRAGQTSRSEVFEQGERRWVRAAVWDVLGGGLVGGSVADARVARISSSVEYSEYSGQSGAQATQAFLYDDTYGFNFISSLTMGRPTGDVVVTRTP